MSTEEIYQDEWYSEAKARQAATHEIGQQIIELAGHSVPVSELLSIRGRTLALQRQRLADCVDHPTAGGGTPSNSPTATTSTASASNRSATSVPGR